MFCLCFVVANNRLVGTSERTCYCFRESERVAIAVLSDLNNVTFMMIRVIIAEVQNGELDVVINIEHDTLSIKHFIFSEQVVLMDGFSTGSPVI